MTASDQRPRYPRGLRPRRRAASDWLPPTAVIVRPIRLRSIASGLRRVDAGEALPAVQRAKLGVNAAGQIVGTGMHDGQARAFILTLR